MCAIFGLIDYGKTFNSRQREQILRVISVECEERGIDATGYAFNENGKLKIVKKPVPAHELWIRLNNESNVILGHTRMTTQGDQKFNYNNHPFYGKAGETNFALAHNGIIYNDEILRKELNLPVTKIETDSYIAVQMLEKFGELSEKSLAEMAEKISGSFVFTLLNEQNNSYFVRGNNPLALYKFKAGFYIYASTEAILESTLKGLGLAKYPHEKIETDCGDILKIDKDGNLSRSTFDISESDCYPVRSFDWSKLYNGESQEIWHLKNFANTIGIDSEDIDILLDCGYDPDEIAELIYEPGAFQEAVYMAMECCYGDAFR
ncbi:MAG: hypothetical protein HDT42_07515 [Ruminococcaceae bacterium]|nr:hypothetical protein [Oscillospiraceae bacterium]